MHGMTGVIAAGARHNRLIRDRLLDNLQELDLLVVAEGRRFAGRARNNDAVRAVRDEHHRQLLGSRVIDGAVLFEGRDHRGEKRSDFLCHHSTPSSIARSAICTAFSAAPLRRLSDTIQSASPWLVEGSSRMRPTYTSSLPATWCGVG